MIEFTQPAWLIVIIPVALAMLVILKKQFTRIEGNVNSIRKTKKWIFISRVVILSLFFIALANPVEIARSEIPTPPKIEILIDNSSSMSMFDTSFVDNLQGSLSREIPVKIKYIGSSLKSDIGDEIMASLEPNKNILLVTDGQVTDGNTLGEVSTYAASLNASVSAVKLNQVKKDTAVTIEGPIKTVTGSNAAFLIDVKDMGLSHGVLVKVDGETLNPEDGIVNVRFATEGYHTVSASLNTDSSDAFSNNNEFYKTIKVVERPNVLFVSKKVDPLQTILESLYKVQVTSTIPADLSPYHAVIINDIPAREIQNFDNLKNYVVEGNGLVVIGGYESFDKADYKDSVFESILPVEVGTGERKSAEANIVIVFDISGSVSGSTEGGTKILEVEKALAVNIIKDLSAGNKVGVIAFNTNAYSVSPLSPLYSSREATIAKISTVVNGGGTTISVGLLGASGMLQNRDGGGNIILISDGLTNGELDKQKSKELARKFKAAGIRLFTVGVGARTDRKFMSELASLGGGTFFKADETNKLKIFFGDPRQVNPGDVFGLVVFDSTHFITEDLEINPSLDAYNQVNPKQSAIMLVSNDFGNPALTVWRYGVGRVVAFNVFTSNNDLGTLLNRENSVVITRAVNWAIGDPERKAAYSVSTQDARLNEIVKVSVKSKSYPQTDEINLVKTGPETYTGNIKPEKVGVYSVLNSQYAVSYEKEFENLGTDPGLEILVEETGGKIFNAEDINDILEHSKSVSRKTQVVEQSLQWIFLAAGLLLFLTEVIFRRLRTIQWANT